MNQSARVVESLGRIRAYGSLLISAGLASDEYEDWSAVTVNGKMVIREAEDLLELFNDLELDGLKKNQATSAKGKNLTPSNLWERKPLPKSEDCGRLTTAD